MRLFSANLRTHKTSDGNQLHPVEVHAKKHSNASGTTETEVDGVCPEGASVSSECLPVNIAICVSIASALAVLLLANYYYFGLGCAAKHTPHSPPPAAVAGVFSDKMRWDGAVRLSLSEKNVTILRALAKNRCYVLPRATQTMRKLQLVREVATAADKLAVIGQDGLKFCGSDRVYLLDNVNPNDASTRPKRQTDSSDDGAATAVTEVTKTDTDPLARSVEERSPRCMDILLDCADGQIGEVHSCFTWINGAMRMEQECLSPTQFKATLSKPTGRLLAVQAEQAKICLERRGKGLRC